METQVNYAQFVGDLCKPGQQIVSTMLPSEAHLIHMAMGVAGEAGELLDAIKKATIYKKKLDIENVVEELGDIEFFMQGIRNELCLSRDLVLQKNHEKLRKRYPVGVYSDGQANARADKK